MKDNNLFKKSRTLLLTHNPTKKTTPCGVAILNRESIIDSTKRI